jgi:streptogramin lyase
VADQQNHRIRNIDTIFGKVSTLAGDGTANFADSTNPLQAKFNYPTGVAVDAAGNVYVADGNNHRIRKISPTGAVSTLAGDGSNSFADNTNPLLAKFSNPTGAAVDAAGNVYVADYNNNRIRKISPTGGVSTLAGDGSRNFADNTNPLLAKFNNPYSVAVDAAGNVYVADSNNHRIRKLTPE